MTFIRNRYDSLMEQYKRLQQAGRELTQKQSGTESAQSALFERIERLEMENGDYAEQLESWQVSLLQIFNNISLSYFSILQNASVIVL